MNAARRRLATLAGIAALAAWAVPAGARAAVMLAAHHASYDLSLASVSGSDTVAATGHMTYQVTDACTSWATQQQLRLDLVTREGGSTETVSDYATLESKDGRRLSFDMRQQSNGKLVTQVRGDAAIGPDGSGVIHYVLPKPATVPLPRGTLFPMAHTAAIIAAAEAGRRSIAPVLFDGTGSDGAQDTYVLILNWQGPPTESPYKPLAAEAAGRVHVSFFARRPGTITPDYESGMRYFANGVSDQLDMDFGDFRMRGTLTSFGLPSNPPRC